MPAAASPLIAALVPYTVGMSFTPGPNNLMLASSGARFGLARTLPHLAGVNLGFAFMTTVVGLGVAGVIAASPLLYAVMKWASVAYILYAAWRTAMAHRPKPDGGAPFRAEPMSFWGAAAFQWINPKGWIMALGAVAAYTTRGGDFARQVAAIVLVFAAIGVCSSTSWALFGQSVRRWLTTDRRQAAFNRTMAVLLAASVAPVIFEH